VEEFKSQGYLPEAIVNYLSLLGWSPPTEGQEIMTLEEIARQFDLSRVLKSPAIFDNQKLDWMDRSYINKTPGDSLVDKAKGFFVDAGLIPAQLDAAARSWLAEMIDLLKTRVDHLDQLAGEAALVYGFEKDPPEIEAAAREILDKPDGSAMAVEFARLAGQKEILTPEIYREIVAQVKAATGKKGRDLFHPIRAALTGHASGPELEKLIPLYETGSRLSLPRKVMSCRERLHAILGSLPSP
jgi:glutamyl/glutaminyl-tRNA synthetase